MKSEKERFNEIAKVVAENVPGIMYIFLDAFVAKEAEHCYIVVKYKGGALKVRNASMNGLIINISELAMLLERPYYSETDYYVELKKQERK